MKTWKYLCIIVRSLFLLIVFLNIAYAESPSDVYKAAESGLPLMLDSIPQGYELRYGFANREEFATATIGLPYQMYTIHPEMLLGNTTLTDDMIVSVEEWRFPVICDGRIRALLTVAKVKGNWQSVDIGAALLASEIDALERDLSLKNRDIKRIILRLYQIKSDFIVITDASAKVTNGAFYPLKSARMGVGGSMRARSTISSLSFQDLLPILKERYRYEYLPVK